MQPAGADLRAAHRLTGQATDRRPNRYLRHDLQFFNRHAATLCDTYRTGSRLERQVSRQPNAPQTAGLAFFEAGARIDSHEMAALDRMQP